jgi:hypothetical protein
LGYTGEAEPPPVTPLAKPSAAPVTAMAATFEVQTANAVARIESFMMEAGCVRVGI